MKIKTYVLMVSTNFPAYHKRKGEETWFPEKILNGIKCIWPEDYNLNPVIDELKIHTIRTNYEWWEKRIKNILAGKAILSIRYWQLPGGCYTKGNSQIEICQLDKDSGIGLQKIELQENMTIVLDNKEYISKWRLSQNDGLSEDDFINWFVDCPEQLMALIHFTRFRY